MSPSSNFLAAGFFSLGRRINKVFGKDGDNDTGEGIVSERFPELRLSMSNEDLLKLADNWFDDWDNSDIKAKFEENGKNAEDYWKGIHFDQTNADKARPLVDNVIFEALETYLPQATRRNPDPIIEIDDEVEASEEDRELATVLQKKLGRIADILKLRLKLKKVARHWAVYLLGVGKLGWDLNNDIPTVKIIRPAKVILDPEATHDEDGYTGDRIGEHRKLSAAVLVSLLEKNDPEEGAIQSIKDLVKNDMGTDVQFIEWWTDEIMFWKLKSQILLKKRNPHWNYNTPEKNGEPVVGEDGQPELDEAGQPRIGEVTEAVVGHNHFNVPKKPYIFLSVFNLGKQPVDDTSLIIQNLASQDKINKRNRQIDKNADGMNNGMVVSLERSGLTQSQAKNVTEALRKGGVVTIPTGAVTDAVARLSAPSLPADVFNDLVDTRTRVRDIFGTSGLLPAGIKSETTVRGKFQTQQLDTDRIGGGVSEYLEQWSDDFYNWCIQLLFVYDNNYAGGKVFPKFLASVKEGSLLPKDSTTIANQAIELASAGKISTLDLFKRLDYPDPEKLAANAWLEVNAPHLLYEDERIKQAVQATAGASSEQPNISIPFAELTPDAQAQALEKAGINADPEGIAAHRDRKAVKEAGERVDEKVAEQEALPELPKLPQKGSKK